MVARIIARASWYEETGFFQKRNLLKHKGHQERGTKEAAYSLTTKNFLILLCDLCETLRALRVLKSIYFQARLPKSGKSDYDGRMFQIREAHRKDAPGIARVHITSWQTSYRGIVPDETLDNQSLERRQGYWEQVIAGEEAGSEAFQFVFVAENDQGEIVGFASGGKSRQETLPFEGEVYAIYLLEAFKRQGIGERLVRAAMDKLLAEGVRSMMLWVLADNLPGRRFYEKMGGRVVMEQLFTLGGKELLEVAYGWEKLED